MINTHCKQQSAYLDLKSYKLYKENISKMEPLKVVLISKLQRCSNESRFSNGQGLWIWKTSKRHVNAKFQQQTGYCSAIVCSIKHGYGRNNINQSKQQSRDHAKIVVAWPPLMRIQKCSVVTNNKCKCLIIPLSLPSILIWLLIIHL